MKSYKIQLPVLFISCCFTSAFTSADITFCNFSKLDSVPLPHAPPLPAHTHTHTTHTHTHLTAKSPSMLKFFSRCSLKYSAASQLIITNASMISYKNISCLIKIRMALCMLVNKLASDKLTLNRAEWSVIKQIGVTQLFHDDDHLPSCTTIKIFFHKISNNS